jgi:hypothetical protein
MAFLAERKLAVTAEDLSRKRAELATLGGGINREVPSYQTSKDKLQRRIDLINELKLAQPRPSLAFETIAGLEAEAALPDRRLLSAPLASVVVERRLPSAEAFNTSAHSLYDIFDVEWFAKLRVDESGRSVVQQRLRPGRHQYHAFGMTPRRCQLANDFNSANAGHHDIEDHSAVIGLLETRERLMYTCRCIRREARLAEHSQDHVAGGIVVVDDENVVDVHFENFPSLFRSVSHACQALNLCPLPAACFQSE